MLNSLKYIVVLAVLGLSGFWALTTPKTVASADFDGLTGAPDKGKRIFNAAGCASCHAAKGATGPDRLILSGGRAFPSGFGTFYAPNISPDPKAGIGNWSLIDLANALQRGTSPSGQHYYPAFPYTTYQNMKPGDLADLYAYLKTLPAAQVPSNAHEVSFPFSMRRGLGLWKLLFMAPGFQIAPDSLTKEQQTGRYLVEALGHCTECHTPRNLLGGLRRSNWLSGSPNPVGKGTIPNITPHGDGIGNWTSMDLVAFFNSGLTPEYDSAGGTMAEVIENLMQLPPEDHKAIAAYLALVPPIPSAKPPKG